MATAVFVKGKFDNFEALRDFTLNFEDRRIKSVKVRVGEVVKYDGDTATYIGKNDIPSTGRCPSLKAAINNLGWMQLKANGKHKDTKANVAPVSPQTAKARTALAGKEPGDDYDPKLGGNFETMLAKSGLNADGTPRRAAPNVIKQDDRVVKKVGTSAKVPVAGTMPKEQQPKREVLNREVSRASAVATPVSSSTSVARTQTHSREIVHTANAGAQQTIPLKSLPKKASAQPKKKTFTVDASTPNVSDDPMTAPTPAEVRRMTSRTVIEASANQDAKVIGRVSQDGKDVQTQEGITLRRTSSVERPATARSGPGNRDIDVSARVIPGEPVPDVGGETRVIGKTTAAAKADGTAPAPAQKGARPAPTNSSAGPKTPVPHPDHKGRPASRIAGQKTAAQAPAKAPAAPEKAPAAPVKAQATGQNYLSMLPDTWADMHWVQKEKYIQGLTDRGFIEFIASVETIKAVVNACKERLKKLDEHTAD